MTFFILFSCACYIPITAHRHCRRRPASARRAASRPDRRRCAAGIRWQFAAARGAPDATGTFWEQGPNFHWLRDHGGLSGAGVQKRQRQSGVASSKNSGRVSGRGWRRPELVAALRVWNTREQEIKQIDDLEFGHFKGSFYCPRVPLSDQFGRKMDGPSLH